MSKRLRVQGTGVSDVEFRGDQWKVQGSGVSDVKFQQYVLHRSGVSDSEFSK